MSMLITWQNIKGTFDSAWVVFLAVMGHIGINWDVAVAKTTSLLAMMILMFKFANMVSRWLENRKKKQEEKLPVDDYEGD